MAIVRVNKTSDYTVMSNTHLRERGMSLKAKGLLTIMLSLPDDWDYSVRGLVAICSEGEHSVETALLELKKFGYLQVVKLMPNETESGRYEYVYEVYETPRNEQQSLNDSEKQETQKQGVENVPLVWGDYRGVSNLSDNTSLGIQVNRESNTKNIYNTCASIVDYLNAKAGTSFHRNSKAAQKHIAARLNDGYVYEDFVKVVNRKCDEWLETELQKFLRPETLFGAKFESYLVGLPQARKQTVGRKQNRALAYQQTPITRNDIGHMVVNLEEEIQNE